MFETLLNLCRETGANTAYLEELLAAAKERANRAAEEVTDAYEKVGKRLLAMEEERAALREEWKALDSRKPKDACSDAYDRWEARRDLLEEHISDVEDEIEDVKSELEDI